MYFTISHQSGFAPLSGNGVPSSGGVHSRPIGQAFPPAPFPTDTLHPVRRLQQAVAMPLPALPAPNIGAQAVVVAQRRSAMELVANESAFHEGPIGELHVAKAMPLALRGEK